VTLFHTAARAATVLAAATMMLSPVFAATATKPKPKPTASVPITLPLSARPDSPTWSPADETVYDHRRWRRYRHGDGIDGGDVLGGLLIIGAVAAAAAAIDKDKQERRQRTEGRDYPYRDDAYRDRPYDYREGEAARDYGRDRYAQDPRAADRAVDACTAEAARTGRVDQIFDVARVDGEWRVKGDFANGREFECTVDANGRAYVGLGDHALNDAADDGPVAKIDDRYSAGQEPDFEDSGGN
jgi:hypothetical protein